MIFIYKITIKLHSMLKLLTIIKEVFHIMKEGEEI